MTNVRQWLIETLQDHEESIDTALFDDIVEMVERAERDTRAATLALKDWKQLVAATHANRVLLNPDINDWQSDVKWIAHCLHTGSIPPLEASKDIPQDNSQYFVIDVDSAGSVLVEVLTRDVVNARLNDGTYKGKNWNREFDDHQDGLMMNAIYVIKGRLVTIDQRPTNVVWELKDA